MSQEQIQELTMVQRVQIVLNKYIEKMPIHYQMMVRPFLNQFHLFSNEIDDETILSFIREIEDNIAYIKGTDSNAN